MRIGKIIKIGTEPEERPEPERTDPPKREEREPAPAEKEPVPAGR